MRYLAIALFVVACGGVEPQQQSPLERQARALLACPSGPLAWSTDLGSIDQAGNFAAPACAAPYADQTAHVTVTGCGNTATIPVAVTDSPKSVAIACGVILPASCCTAGPTFTVAPGGTIQFYAAVQYNCAGHVTYSSVPPPFCP